MKEATEARSVCGFLAFGSLEKTYLYTFSGTKEQVMVLQCACYPQILMYEMQVWEPNLCTI